MGREPYEVGIVGYGSSAKIFHIPFIRASPRFHLHSVVQRQVRPGQADARKELPGVKVHGSLYDMLQDARVQLVIISTPPDSHLELATAALRADKHVVIEKPFAPTFAEAEALISLARERQLLLTVYQNRRWDSDFLILKSLKEQGTLGRIVEVESHFDRFRPTLPVDTWKAHPSPGNSAIYDLGTHLIDQVVHLFGVPDRVTGFVGSQRTPAINTTGLEDSFTVLLHYSDGMLATVKAGVISPEPQQLRFWVRGDRASFRKYGLDPQEAQLKRGMQPSDPGFGVEEEEESSRGLLTVITNDGSTATFTEGTVRLSSVVEQGNGTYSMFYSSLASAIDSGDHNQLPVTGKEAALLIRLVELVLESSRCGQTMMV